MSGKYHIDPGFFCRCGDISSHRCAATSGICIICRLMDRQDLPCCVTRLCILYQPIHRCLHVTDIATVIHNCHIYIAVGCGPAAARSMYGQVKNAADNIRMGIALELMVAQHMDDIRIPQISSTQQIDGLGSLPITGGLVYRITGLNAKIILTNFQFIKDVCNICAILCLNISQQEEFLSSIFHCPAVEYSSLRPAIAAAHLIFVAGIRFQACHRYFIDIRSLIAIGHKGPQHCLRRQNSPFLISLFTVAQKLCICFHRIRQPGKILPVCSTACGSIKHHLRHLNVYRIISINIVAQRHLTIFGFCINPYHACGLKSFRMQYAAFISRSKLFIAAIHIDHSVCHTAATQVCYLQFRSLSRQHRTTGHGNCRTHRQRLYRSCKCTRLSVLVIANTGLNFIKEALTGCQCCRNLYL